MLQSEVCVQTWSSCSPCSLTVLVSDPGPVVQPGLHPETHRDGVFPFVLDQVPNIQSVSGMLAQFTVFYSLSGRSSWFPWSSVCRCSIFTLPPENNCRRRRRERRGREVCWSVTEFTLKIIFITVRKIYTYLNHILCLRSQSVCLFIFLLLILVFSFYRPN